MADLVAVEVHDINIVRLYALARWWARSALAGMCGIKDAKRAYALPCVVGGKRPEFVSSVRHEHEKSLHPVCIPLKSFNVGKRLRLAEKVASGLQYALQTS